MPAVAIIGAGNAFLALGAFVTEGSGHFSEYVPYFRKRPDLGETGFYANNWPIWRQESDDWIRQMREAAFYALMLDSLTATVCSPAEIRQMFDEMAAVEAAYLPEWMQA